jgi:ATP-binding cassette subfamily B multidrug efflux pump
VTSSAATGAIDFGPVDKTQSPEATKSVSVLARIMRMTFQHPWQCTFAIASTVVACIFQLAIPTLLGNAVDRSQSILTAGTDTATAEGALWGIGLTLLAASILRGIFTLFQNYFGESVGHYVGYELRLQYYKKLQELSFSFHDHVHTGDLITLGLLDLEGIRMFPGTGALRVVFLGILVGVGAYQLMSTDFVLGLLALSFVPFVAWRSSVCQILLRTTWSVMQERLAVLTRVMEENLAGIRVVRAFAAQQHEMDKFVTASKHALELAFVRVGIRVNNTAAMNCAFLASMGLVLWVGGGQVIDGRISVGTLTAFLTYMTILQMPVRQLGLMVNSFARAATCGRRLFAVIDLEPEVADKPGAKDLVVTEGVLRFENVDFRYAGDPKLVISNVSFEARPGDTIALIGPPGSGKSTIAHLIPRFYDVSGGRITIDGQDIRDVKLRSLRQAVAVVQQDSYLFTASIENNVTYGDPWAPEQRVSRASESAQLHNYVTGLPASYETLVGERGVSLSGGQRQRLSIARSLILKAQFMVFDDSVAAIDAATEQKIQAAISRSSKDRVTLIIAHRLNTIMHADRILFIENGTIVEKGTHNELLALGGRYRALYDLQVRPSDKLAARPEPQLGAA